MFTTGAEDLGKLEEGGGGGGALGVYLPPLATFFPLYGV